MAWTLTISDGTTSVNLITGGANGVAAIDAIALPPPVELTSRVSGFPFHDGGRMTASALDDRAWDIPFFIVGTSVDNVDSQLHALNRLLRQAVTWERDRTGSPVRISFARDGTTNTAWARVTGVPAMPSFDGGQLGLGSETRANVLTGVMTLLLEPVWHAGAATTIHNAAAITNVANSNTATLSSPAGDMPGPLAIRVTPGSTGTYSTVLLATSPGSIQATSYTGLAMADAWGGQVESLSVSGTAAGTSTGALTLLSAYQYPIRMLFRSFIASGTAAKVQLRWTLSYSSMTVYGPWLTPYSSGNWTLSDLGSLPTLQHVFNRGFQSSISVLPGFQWRTSDGSAATIYADYTELVPYRSFVRMDELNIVQASSDAAVYESIFTDGAFAYPRNAPAAYGLTGGTALERNATRYGKLDFIPSGVDTTIWVAWVSSAGHRIADTAVLRVDHLPAYAQPLRGAG